MEDNICIECGQEMEVTVIKEASIKGRRIARYECSCGFQTSVEPNIEKLRRIHGNEREDEKRNKGEVDSFDGILDLI